MKYTSKVSARIAATLITMGSSIGGAQGAIPLITAGFNDPANFNVAGTIPNWTTSGGAGIRGDGSLPNPFEGNGYLAGFSTPLFTASQDVDLVAAGFSTIAIDSGSLIANYGGYQAGFGNGDTDTGVISLEFFDAGMASLGISSLASFTSDQLWTAMSGSEAIPVGTRTIEYKFTGTRNSGSNNDAYLDAAFLEVVPEPSSATLLGLGGCGFLAMRRRNNEVKQVAVARESL